MAFYTPILEALQEPLAVLPVEQAEWLLLYPIALIIIFFLVRYNAVKTVDIDEKSRLRKARFWVFFSRALSILFLLVALATPFIEITEETAGNPHITLLIDESNSMDVMQTEFLPEFRAALEERVPVNVRTIGSNEESRLGDAILDNLEPGAHILMVSDGNAMTGTMLEDVAFFAVNSLNASLNAVQLEADENDAAISIIGPETVVAGSSNKYFVHVSANHQLPLQILVTLDGQTIFDEVTTDRVLKFEKEFALGDHKIEAKLDTVDHFETNNQFYKTVRVLEKPKILLVSDKSSPVESILKELYTVTKVGKMPNDISEYYAVIANDVDSSRLSNTALLHDYLIDEEGGFFGNGLVTIGGFNSYDRGNYQNAPIESLLPVKVGKGESKKGDDNIVIILDISGGSTGIRYEKQCTGQICDWVEVHDAVSALDIIKAQAMNLISSEKNIIATNKVGVIAFGAQGTVEDRSQGHYEAVTTIKVIEDLDFLYNNQGVLKEKIPRLVGGGPSEIGLALQAAHNMLKDRPGSSNYILLLTDGNVAPRVQKEAINMIAQLQNRGVKVFTYGVGRSEPNVMGEFLKQAAEIGDGLYEGPVITTKDVNPARISIQWGNPDQKGFGDEFGLITFSLTHFITQGIEPSAKLNGYNQVSPKSTAQMIMTTDFGQPALTVWNYGNGRVGALTVFTGGGLGELLNADNSQLITRVVNWAIGDPQRKEAFTVIISDARIGEPTIVTVRSDETITSESVEFVKDGNKYTATFQPQTLGFGEFFGADYATNYVREYEKVGMNIALNRTLALTNGKVFSHEAIDEIVEHVSELSRRRVALRKPFIWPFIVAAVIVFLIEAYIRRFLQKTR